MKRKPLDTVRRFVHEPHSIEGPSRVVAATLHDGMVRQEAALIRLADAVLPRPALNSVAVDRVTAVIKTFERPKALRRLVESLRRLYPGLRIVVVDDSREPSRLPGTDTVVLPYDSGIAAGRNAGLQQVRTDYALMLDDDYIFFRGSGLGAAIRVLDDAPDIDIVGGQLIDLPLFTRRPLRDVAGTIFSSSSKPIAPIGSTIAGAQVVEKVPTFFLARPGRLAVVGWDPRLKRLDHGDFFTRAHGVLVTVFDPRLRCFHARTPFDRRYMAARLDIAESRRLLAERYDT